MNSIEKLKKLNNDIINNALVCNDQLKLINAKFDKLSIEQRNIENVLSSILDAYLMDKDNSPLLDGVWNLNINDSYEFYLTYYGDKHFKILSYLYEDDHHCSSTFLDQKFIIYYNDGDITINSYMESDLFKDLIEPLNLKFRNNAASKLENINEQIVKLNAIKNLISSKLYTILPKKEYTEADFKNLINEDIPCALFHVSHTDLNEDGIPLESKILIEILNKNPWALKFKNLKFFMTYFNIDI